MTARWLTIGLIAILSIIIFVTRVQKCGFDCDDCTERVVTKTHTDTIIRYRTEYLYWKPTENKNILTRIEYMPTYSTLDTNKPLTPTINRVHDSIMSPSGIGLTFDHLISNNAIILSEYKIRLPEISINTSSETTRYLQIRKQAFSFGVDAYMYIGPEQPTWMESIRRNFDLVPKVGYRYDRLSVQVGYGVLQKTVHVGISREL